MGIFWRIIGGRPDTDEPIVPEQPVTPPVRRLRPPPPILAKLHGPILEHWAADFKRGRGSAVIDLLVLHDTDGAVDGALQWLTAAKPPEVSAHYVVARDGRVWRLVPEADTAYHAGGGTWRGKGGVNSRSIGIELERRHTDTGAYPQAQLEACVWLSVDLCRRYALDPLTQIEAHAVLDPARRTDPREFPWADFRAAVAYYLADGGRS